MKEILYEQLPLELILKFTQMEAELKELKRMIEKGEVDMAVTEAEFNVVKERVLNLEGEMQTIKQQLIDLDIDPGELQKLLSDVALITKDITGIKSYNASNTQMVSALTERIKTIETKHIAISLEQLNIPATTTKDIVLPTIDDLLTTFVWSSSHPQIISQSGTVVRPTATEGNVSVTLTVDATYGKTISNKTFVVSITAEEPSDTEKIDAIAEKVNDTLFIGAVEESVIRIKENQTLPLTLEEASISWVSSEPTVFSDQGIVTRPEDEDKPVTLTASIALNLESREKVFNLIVEKLDPPVIEPEPEEPEEDLEP